MATPQSSLKLSGIANRLIIDNLLPEVEVQKAWQAAERQKTSFVHYLVENKLMDARQLAALASQEFGLPLLDLGAVNPADFPTNLIKGKDDESLIAKHRVLPLLKRGNRLYVAVADPTNHQGLEEIRFATGLLTDAILVEDNKLTKILETMGQDAAQAMDGVTDADLENLAVADEESESQDSEINVDDAPIVRYVNKVLMDAILKGASDVHFEPYEKFYRVRLRIDGILREVAQPPSNMGGRLAARLKVMSRMNIAERRVPQDGRIKLKLSKNRDIDFRVNTLPTLYGEKIVLRILDSSVAKVGVDQLGFDPIQKEHFMKALFKPYGMILVTGPTGSGKTVSLYTGLNLLNSADVNISTAEDPVEIQVPGINQVNVNPQTGLTFAAALRAFLRQDPDIIMVGEIRDLETAEIAVKAAQTGHMVLSTLHTNDAPQTLTRLANMGVPPFNIASAVNLIMAQRLARRLCEHCKTPNTNVTKEVLIEEGFTPEEVKAGITIFKPVGCEKCTGGYKGRVGIFQVMPVSEEMGRLIMEGCTSIQLADQAYHEGVNDLRQSGLNKVKAGLTSLEELNRVTKD